MSRKMVTKGIEKHVMPLIQIDKQFAEDIGLGKL